MSGRKRRRLAGPTARASGGTSPPPPRPPRTTEHQPTLLNRRFSYTDELHAQFEADGFLVVDRFLGRRALLRLRDAVDAVYASKCGVVHDEWVLGLHQVLPDNDNWMRELATEPRLLEMLERHLGPDLVLFSTQLATKRPGDGRFVPWHQDGERCRTVWVPLDDVDASNGALRMMPGLHTRGRLDFQRVVTRADVEQFEFFHDYRLYATDVPSDSRDSVTCEMEAGGLECHHPSTPHGSLPNSSAGRWRRAIIMRFQPASEPLEAGLLRHWQTGEQFRKVNYLVLGTHPGLDADETLDGPTIRRFTRPEERSGPMSTLLN